METTTEKKEEKKRMPKTVQPNEVVIGDKGYDKCPFPGCDHMVEIQGYNPKSGLRPMKISSSDPNRDIYAHIRQAHRLVWLRKGKTAGWWSLSKFHPKPEDERFRAATSK